MRVQIVTDVTTEPIDTDFLKSYFNQLEDFSADEIADLNIKIKASREVCENYCGVALAAKTLLAWYDAKGVEENERYIELPFTPHSSITSVIPVDITGTDQTALEAGSGYYLYGNAGGEYEIYVPTILATVGDSVSLSNYKVTYVCGYGAANCEGIPNIFKIVMAELIQGWWKNKGEEFIPVLTAEMRTNLTPYKKIIF